MNHECLGLGMAANIFVGIFLSMFWFLWEESTSWQTVTFLPFFGFGEKKSDHGTFKIPKSK